MFQISFTMRFQTFCWLKLACPTNPRPSWRNMGQFWCFSFFLGTAQRESAAQKTQKCCTHFGGQAFCLRFVCVPSRITTGGIWPHHLCNVLPRRGQHCTSILITSTQIPARKCTLQMVPFQCHSLQTERENPRIRSKRHTITKFLGKQWIDAPC